MSGIFDIDTAELVKAERAMEQYAASVNRSPSEFKARFDEAGKFAEVLPVSSLPYIMGSVPLAKDSIWWSKVEQRAKEDDRGQ